MVHQPHHDVGNGGPQGSSSLCSNGIDGHPQHPVPSFPWCTLGDTAQLWTFITQQRMPGSVYVGGGRCPLIKQNRPVFLVRLARVPFSLTLP